jgi:hypothetical protein
MRRFAYSTFSAVISSVSILSLNPLLVRSAGSLPTAILTAAAIGILFHLITTHLLRRYQRKADEGDGRWTLGAALLLPAAGWILLQAESLGVGAAAFLGALAAGFAFGLKRASIPAVVMVMTLVLSAWNPMPTLALQGVSIPTGSDPSQVGVSSSQVGGITPDILVEIGEAPDPARIRRDLETLVSFGTRHTLSDTLSDERGIGAARRWIHREFEAISASCGGCLEVMYVSGIVQGEQRIPNPVDVVSVIAVQRGTTDPDRVAVMAGDIDSRVSDVMDFTSDSPGANDNATGIAGVLEAARVLSRYTFNGTIVYAALAGEEQGLFGGKILAEYALNRGWRVKAVLNNDMIGNISGINGVIDNRTIRVFSEGTRATESEQEARLRRFTGGEVDSPSRNLARYIKLLGESHMTNTEIMMVYRLDRFGRGGHHRPFNEAGIPGVRVMEAWEHYDRQHQDLRKENGIDYGDVLSGVDMAYAAKATGLNAIVLASLSWSPPPPANVRILGAVRPSTTLLWDKADPATNPQVKGYRIHWRLTDQPMWQWSRYVGDVSEFTLENVVIDNYYFGVSSVSEEGFESPVVFPGPAGDFGR